MIDANFWPSPDVFLDISGAARISDDRARCTAVAMCDADGQPTRVFRQGQPVHFFYEFEILAPLDMVSGGLEFHDAANRVIHGKNSFQHGPSPQSANPGTRLRYHHVIDLEIGPGEYWFTIGLASADVEAYQAYREGAIGHEQFNEHTYEHCRVINVSSFTVHLDPADKLLHHGIANLPSTYDVTIVEGQVEQAPSASYVQNARVSSPTIIHVTHWKAGSQWIHRILLECVPDIIVSPQLGEVQFMNWPVQASRVYPTVYVTKQQFDRVRLPTNSRHFVVIRDLRDTLISAYFSMKISHPIQEANLPRLRAILESMSIEDGLIYMIREWLPGCAKIQLSWLEAGEQLIRYEDLLERDLEILEPLLIDYCELPVSRERLREAVHANKFAKVTKGRERGIEDTGAHERKGIAGDWQNHFTDPVKQAFNIRFGGLLVATGYEQDLHW